MCEKCRAEQAQNTITKRAAMDVLFAPPHIGSGHHAEMSAVPGLVDFCAIATELEMLSRDKSNDEARRESATAVALRGQLLALTPEDRTAVIRIAEWVTELASSVSMNTAAAKGEANDADGTLLSVTLEGRTLVVRANGQEVQRVELEPEQDADAALDATERAMQAHRSAYHSGGAE